MLYLDSKLSLTMPCLNCMCFTGLETTCQSSMSYFDILNTEFKDMAIHIALLSLILHPG